MRGDFTGGGRRSEGCGNRVDTSRYLQELNTWQEETARHFLLRDFRNLVIQDAEIDVHEDPRAVLEGVMLLD